MHSSVVLAWSRPLHSQIQLWRSNGVQLQNVDPVTFFVMIRFMYTGRVRLTIDTATQLLLTAQRFEVLPLVLICRSFIARVALGSADTDGVNSGAGVLPQVSEAEMGQEAEARQKEQLNQNKKQKRSSPRKGAGTGKATKMVAEVNAADKETPPANNAQRDQQWRRSEAALEAMGIKQVCALIKFSTEYVWPELQERAVRFVIDHLEGALDVYPGLMHLNLSSFTRLLQRALARRAGGESGSRSGSGVGAKDEDAGAGTETAGRPRAVVLLRAAAQWLSAGASQRVVWDEQSANQLLALLPWPELEAREVAAMAGVFPTLQQSKLVKRVMRSGNGSQGAAAGADAPPPYASTISPPLPSVPSAEQQREAMRQKAMLGEFGLSYGGTLELWERVQSGTLRKRRRAHCGSSASGILFDSEVAAVGGSKRARRSQSS